MKNREVVEWCDSVLVGEAEERMSDGCCQDICGCAWNFQRVIKTKRDKNK